MYPIVKKINVTDESTRVYFSQSSIIRKTNTSSTLNYGKINIMVDADVDG